MPFVQEILCNVRYFAGVNGDVVISSASQVTFHSSYKWRLSQFSSCKSGFVLITRQSRENKRSSAGLNQLVLRLMERDCTNE